MLRATVCATCLALCTTVAAAPRRGVALGLFSEDAGWSYAPLLDEIRRLGATDVELVVPLYQADVAATQVGYHPRYSPPLATIRRTIDEAHRRKLRVLLFPIVRLRETHGPNEWRGTLRPTDRVAWRDSYGQRLAELAALAKKTHVEALVLGSELSTLDVDLAFWRPLIEALRRSYPGELVYSANWDHYDAVALWPLVDRIGVCAYFPLAGTEAPTLASVVAAWQGPLRALGALSTRWRRPVLLTEVGYRSQPNALREPWDEGGAAPADAASLELQRLAFSAFAAVLTPSPSWLDGFYVWNWYGWGGDRSSGYSPRGKPAVREIEKLLNATSPSAAR
jgi:hypothetical protein